MHALIQMVIIAHFKQRFFPGQIKVKKKKKGTTTEIISFALMQYRFSPILFLSRIIFYLSRRNIIIIRLILRIKKFIAIYIRDRSIR